MQLPDLKAVNTVAKASLLDYLVEVLDVHLPHLLRLPIELDPVTSAARIDYDWARAEVDRLQGEMDLVASELQYARLRGRAGARAFLSVGPNGARKVRVHVYTDRFEHVMSSFAETGAKEVSQLQHALAELNAIFPELVLYFGESPGGCSPNDVIHGTARFVKLFAEARDRLAKRKEKGGSGLLPLAPGPGAQGAPSEGLRRRSTVRAPTRGSGPPTVPRLHSTMG